MTIRITFNAKAMDNLDQLKGKNRLALKRALHNIGRDVKREVKRIIKTGTRTGKWYTYQGIPYQASKAGEPPANRSGKLASSAYFRVHNWHTMEFGEHELYAKYLEYGTGKMKARPHMSVAIQNKRQSAVNEIYRELTKANN